ncbi:DoxX family protein [Croceitalea sp. P059]|uniref:DoxX family protein n=1 Tax=Croceitalea sp. P059 TaxID=3075601 RepID=UPI0028870ABA|nr:DoxX family protein [Croceitalea sp. P059]MDT0538849.1 DoxX family protein [Croceitalea sp. P059]
MDYPNVNAFSLSLIVFLVGSGLSFLVFGFSCLFSPYMVAEFKRYGLITYRRLNGYLQVIGGLGLFLSFYKPLIGIIASLGLAVLMLLGFLVRLKIKDGFIKSFPAFFYMIINGIICFLLWNQ